MTDRRAPSIYMTLAADGTREEESQLSLPRKAFMALCATLLLLSAPLLWAGMAQAGPDSPFAVLSKSGSDDEDNSGPSGDDDDDTGPGTRATADSATTTNSANTGPGTNTMSVTDTAGDNTRGENTADDDTRGKTGDARDDATGRETHGQNTDRAGNHTGVSTRGETDPGDKTGKTEQR